MNPLNRHFISRDEALKTWNNPELKHLFELAFDDFEQYWAEVSAINKMSDIAYLKVIKQVTNLMNVRCLIQLYAEQKSRTLPKDRS